MAITSATIALAFQSASTGGRAEPDCADPIVATAATKRQRAYGLRWAFVIICISARLGDAVVLGDSERNRARSEAVAGRAEG